MGRGNKDRTEDSLKRGRGSGTAFFSGMFEGGASRKKEGGRVLVKIGREMCSKRNTFLVRGLYSESSLRRLCRIRHFERRREDEQGQRKQR